MSARGPARLKELEVKYRGIAIEDGLREAAEALASAIGEGPTSERPRTPGSNYPFERALAQHFRKMEARYGSLLDGTPDALVVTDSTGEIVLVNSRAALEFDFDAHDLVGTRLMQIGSGQLLDRLASIGAEATLTELGDRALVGVEFTGLRRDGSRFPAEATLGLVEASEGTLLLLAIRNIAARKVADRNLAAGAIRAHGLIDNAPVPLIITNKRNRIVAINIAAQRLFGHDSDEIAGEPVDTILPAALAEALLASHDDDAEMNGSWTNYEGVRKDGTPLLFEAAISAVQDAQGRVAIVAIRETGSTPAIDRGHLAADALRAAPDALLVVDARGDIVLLNAEAERRFGYGEAELAGRSVSRILPHGFTERLQPDTIRSAEAALARELGTGIELVGERRDGSRFPVEILLAPLEAGGSQYWIATLRDLSVRRATERRSAQADSNMPAAIASSGESADLQQFAYLVAHDLQEPLRMVASYTHLLAERYKGQLDADADEFLGYAVDGARRMQVLIADMLGYCRVDTAGLHPERLAANDLLAQALLNLKPAIAESGARITHDDLPAITGDRTQLLQLLQNLIGNAIKYRGAEPLTVNISARRTDSGEWEFAVADNGIGIAPDDIDKIFAMFHRLHRHDVIPGSGIGLAAARRVVERHGGHLWATSTPGSGSTFYFTLPDAGDA